MSEELEAINFNITKYPTLISVVSHLAGRWIDDKEDLEPPPKEAREAKEQNRIDIVNQVVMLTILGQYKPIGD
ncbi:hypothetical protein ACTG24_15925 [Aeromonas veronii]